MSAVRALHRFIHEPAVCLFWRELHFIAGQQRFSVIESFGKVDVNWFPCPFETFQYADNVARHVTVSADRRIAAVRSNH